MYAWLDTKPCSLCHAEKPLDQFYRRTRSRDGRQAACIPCTRSALDAADERRRAARQAAATTPPAPARPARPRRPAAYRPAANAWERSTGRPRLMRPARLADLDNLAQSLAADAELVADALSGDGG